MTNILVVFMLLIACNTSLSASVLVDDDPCDLKNARFFIDGASHNILEDDQTHINGIVIDVIVKPRSVRKNSVLAEQMDGECTYRLLQNGRCFVFEVNVNERTYQVKTDNQLVRGERVLLSAYCKEGNIGITLNGKTFVNNIYQINSDNLASLSCAHVDQETIKQLVLLNNESFYELSAFRKALRKNIGRKAFKKYADKIIYIAHQEVELESVNIGDGFVIGDSPLQVGNKYAGIVEQARIWQPAKLIAAKKEVEQILKGTHKNYLEFPKVQNLDLAVLNNGLLNELQEEEKTVVEAHKLLKVKVVDVDCGLVGEEIVNETSQQSYSTVLLDAIFCAQSEYLSMSEQTSLKNRNTLLGFGNDSNEISAVQHILENDSCKTCFLSEQEEVLPCLLFSDEKGKDSRGVSYVNIKLIDKTVLAVKSDFNLREKSQEAKSKIHLTSSKKDFSPGKTLLRLLEEIKNIENQNKCYEISKMTLTSRQDRVTNPETKTTALKISSISWWKLSNELLFLTKMKFYNSNQEVSRLRISPSECVKYVNKNCGLCDIFEEVLATNSASEKSRIANIEFCKERNQSGIRNSELTFIDRSGSYHNERGLITLSEKNKISRHENLKSKRAQYEIIFGLNEDLITHRQKLICSNEQLCIHRKENVHDSNISVEQIFNITLSRYLLKEYEAPPDIMLQSLVYFSRSSIDDEDIQNVFG